MAIVVVTLGRVVPRKGAAWFAGNVLATLPHNMVYVVAGTGPDTGRVLRAAATAGALPRLLMAGLVDNEQREWLLRGCDVFVQPNVSVPGDVEGFGSVVVEAALRGTPVVASGIEGIRDAVIDGVTGFLLPAGDATAWSDWLSAHADRDLLAAMGDRVEVGGVRYVRTRSDDSAPRADCLRVVNVPQLRFATHDRSPVPGAERIRLR